MRFLHFSGNTQPFDRAWGTPFRIQDYTTSESITTLQPRIATPAVDPKASDSEKEEQRGLDHGLVFDRVTTDSDLDEDAADEQNAEVDDVHDERSPSARVRGVLSEITSEQDQSHACEDAKRGGSRLPSSRSS